MANPIRKEVRKLKGYRLEHQYGRIKLNQNESPRDLPMVIKDKALQRMRETVWNRYTTAYCEPLRKKIAQREGLDPASVVVTGGSNILIQALMVAASVRSTVLTVTPSFSLYEIEGSLLGNKVVEVPLNKEDFSLPVELFLRTLKATKPNMVFLANPNAPTGNLFPEKDLTRIVASASKIGALVVIDEAYYPFSGFTMAGSLKKFPNLVLLRTLSKAFSLGGVRLGYLMAHPRVAVEVLKVILPFSVGILQQIVGETVLEEDAYVRGVVEEIVSERELVYRALKTFRGLTVHPSSANYVLFRSPKAGVIFKKLVEQGILIRDVSSKRLPNALRVTIGTREENKAFLEAMKGIVPG